MEQMSTLDGIKEIEKCIKSGQYPVVDEHLFDKVFDYKPSQKAIEQKKWLLEEYNEYLDLLMSLPQDLLDAFLDVIKKYDIKDNQKLEKEQEFLLDVQDVRLDRILPHAIDFLCEVDDNLSSIGLQQAHGLLMEGTSNGSSNDYFYRKQNNKIVGAMVDGNREIYYIPPRVDDIEMLASKFLEFYNDEQLNKDIFTHPIMAHGLLATMQLFDDGNTRLARLLQHTKLYKQTNELLGYDFTAPIIYNTRTYYPERKKYRSFTIEMAKDANNEILDEWNIYNYRLFLNQIYKNEEDVRRLTLIR